MAPITRRTTLVKGKFSSTYCDGQPENVAFNTVLAPNSPSCTNNNNGNSDSDVSVLSASSYHPGGVLCLLADGSVRFVTNSIDTGNLGVATSLGPESLRRLGGTRDAGRKREHRELLGPFRSDLSDGFMCRSERCETCCWSR